MEDFIEKVKMNPCLWDVDSLVYRDVPRKDACWESVAKECGMESGKEAKMLWKRLRDSHREALRRRRQGTNIARPWKYEQLMEFILPYGGCGLGSNSSGVASAKESNEKYDNEPDEVQIKEESDVVNELIAQAPRMIKRNPKRNKVTLKIFEERALRRRRDVASIAARKSMKMVSVNRIQPASCSQSDALSELFSSMCKKTRQLPRHLQLRVQREMFECVTRAEEEALCYGDADISMIDSQSASSSYLFKTSPPSELDSESAAASRDGEIEIE